MLKNILPWAIFTVKDTAGLAVLINKCQNVFCLKMPIQRADFINFKKKLALNT